MKSSILRKGLLGFAAVGLTAAMLTTTAYAQVEKPQQISVQGTALITKDTTDEIPSHEASRSGGFLVGYSYQFSKWFGAEGNYGYSRNTQNYVTTGGPSSLQADFHEVIGSLVVHIPTNGRIRPYALGGGGALIFDPTDKFIVPGADRQTIGTFVYGGGANFDITSRFGLRAEYRGLVYKTPDFGLDSLNLDKFTHLAQPSAGFYFRF